MYVMKWDTNDVLFVLFCHLALKSTICNETTVSQSQYDTSIRLKRTVNIYKVLSW